MTTLDDVRESLRRVQAMSPDERLAFLVALRALFCLHCGEDYPAWSPGICHCTNDE